MPSEERLYTPAEAAAVSGLNVKAVNNAIDKRIVDVTRAADAKIGRARRRQRFITADDLVRLRLEHGLAGRLPVERRQGLFRELARNPRARTLKADDLLLVDIGEARRQVAGRMRDLREAENLVERNKEVRGGDPVFRGTRIPVYTMIAMLENGATEAEILEGWTKLDARKLELARLWVTAHPQRGRPKSLADYGFKLVSTTRRPLGPDPLPDTAREPA